jgi:hypothetical protein
MTKHSLTLNCSKQRQHFISPSITHGCWRFVSSAVTVTKLQDRTWRHCGCISRMGNTLFLVLWSVHAVSEVSAPSMKCLRCLWSVRAVSEVSTLSLKYPRCLWSVHTVSKANPPSYSIGILVNWLRHEANHSTSCSTKVHTPGNCTSSRDAQGLLYEQNTELGWLWQYDDY